MQSENKAPRETKKAHSSELAARFVRELRTGKAQPCPECGFGMVSTEYDPKTSHFFRCNNCSFMVHID